MKKYKLKALSAGLNSSFYGQRASRLFGVAGVHIFYNITLWQNIQVKQNP